MPETTPIPVVAFVGAGDSGKTTVVEGVVAELTARGRRVATVKHHTHDFEIDIEGKDSWRHAQAGAVVSMVSGPAKLGLVRRQTRELTLEELAAIAAPDADILVAEGFKRMARTKIEVARRANTRELVTAPSELVALVTDDDHAVGELPVFHLDDHAGLADFIERTFLSGPVA
jgi:molybdopterin-guanine dinucleotide biosynthesis protein MobB